MPQPSVPLPRRRPAAAVPPTPQPAAADSPTAATSQQPAAGHDVGARLPPVAPSLGPFLATPERNSDEAAHAQTLVPGGTPVPATPPAAAASAGSASEGAAPTAEDVADASQERDGGDDAVSAAGAERPVHSAASTEITPAEDDVTEVAEEVGI